MSSDIRYPKKDTANEHLLFEALSNWRLRFLEKGPGVEAGFASKWTKALKNNIVCILAVAPQVEKSRPLCNMAIWSFKDKSRTLTSMLMHWWFICIKSNTVQRKFLIALMRNQKWTSCMDELAFTSCKNRFCIVLLIHVCGDLNKDQQAPKLPFKKKMSEPAGTIFVKN